jgi:hypothetical protein
VAKDLLKFAKKFCPRCKARDEARAKLAPEIQGTGGKLRPWLKQNPEARDIVELWLEMVPAGESRVGLRGLVKLLQDEHGLPWSDPSGLGYRLREIYGERYQAVVEMNRR